MARLISLRPPVVHAVTADTALSDAAGLLQAHGIDAAVVRDGDDFLAGVLSLRDIAGAAVRCPAVAPRDLRVADAMARDLAHAELSTTVPQALAMLDELKRDHLPVLADGRVAALISRSELMEQLVWHYTEEIREIRLQERIMHLQGTYSC